MPQGSAVDEGASGREILGPESLRAALRQEAMRLGFARVGVAPAVTPPHHDAFRGWLSAGLAGVMQSWLERHEPLRRSPEAILPGARSLIMLATDYSVGGGATAEPIVPGHGRVARYARGADYHDVLRPRLNSLVQWLEERVPGARARGVVDSAPLAERDYAQLAGLGWFGKNTMLIDTRAGSYFFLSAIVTDLVLAVDSPLETDHCGTCTACLEACPTGALPAPGVLDATKCISALTIEDHGAIAPSLRNDFGDWIFGCDICQEVCPWNRHAPGSTDPAFQSGDEDQALDLAGVLSLDDDGFRNRFRDSPIVRAKRHGLARSAAIALGNHPHPPALSVLIVALADTDPVVRCAAAWALGRWIAHGIGAEEGRRALEHRRPLESDASVQAEITVALSAYDPASVQSRISSMSDDGSRPGPSAE